MIRAVSPDFNFRVGSHSNGTSYEKNRRKMDKSAARARRGIEEHKFQNELDRIMKEHEL